MKRFFFTICALALFLGVCYVIDGSLLYLARSVGYMVGFILGPGVLLAGVLLVRRAGTASTFAAGILTGLFLQFGVKLAMVYLEDPLWVYAPLVAWLFCLLPSGRRVITHSVASALRYWRTLNRAALLGLVIVGFYMLILSLGRTPTNGPDFQKIDAHVTWHASIVAGLADSFPAKEMHSGGETREALHVLLHIIGSNYGEVTSTSGLRFIARDMYYMGLPLLFLSLACCARRFGLTGSYHAYAVGLGVCGADFLLVNLGTNQLYAPQLLGHINLLACLALLGGAGSWRGSRLVALAMGVYLLSGSRIHGALFFGALTVVLFLLPRRFVVLSDAPFRGIRSRLVPLLLVALALGYWTFHVYGASSNLAQMLAEDRKGDMPFYFLFSIMHSAGLRGITDMLYGTLGGSYLSTVIMSFICILAMPIGLVLAGGATLITMPRLWRKFRARGFTYNEVVLLSALFGALGGVMVLQITDSTISLFYGFGIQCLFLLFVLQLQEVTLLNRVGPLLGSDVADPLEEAGEGRLGGRCLGWIWVVILFLPFWRLGENALDLNAMRLHNLYASGPFYGEEKRKALDALHTEHGYMSLAQIHALEYIRTQTPPETVVVAPFAVRGAPNAFNRYNYMISSFSGRQAYLETHNREWPWNADQARRQKEMAALEETGTLTPGLEADENVFLLTQEEIGRISAPYKVLFREGEWAVISLKTSQR